MAKKVGRPSDYNQKKADLICAMIAEGKSIRTICASEDMPAMETFYRWLRTFPEFQEQYARAKEDQSDALAEEMLDIADDGTNDWMEKFGRDGESIGWVVNGEAVQRSKLRVEARKWLASKMKPKRYGDKITTEHTGANGGPVQIEAMPPADAYRKLLETT